MADNTRLSPGSGGDVIKTEDIGPYKLAVSKIYLGGHGIDGGAVTATNPFPVSVGNFPATQAVSGTVSVANLPTTQAVSATALPLPSGAAVASKQPAPGLAGAPAADVLTVQGAPAMTPLKVDGSAVTQPVSLVGAATTTANLFVGGLAVSTANPIPVTAASALPAGTNTIGGVIAQLATGVIYSNGAAVTPMFAPIAASSPGNNTVVAATAGKKIRVLKYTIVASGAVSVKFNSPSGSDLTGAMPLATNSGVGGAFCPVGLFETVAGDPLVLNLSAGVSVAGHITYIQV